MDHFGECGCIRHLNINETVEFKINTYIMKVFEYLDRISMMHKLVSRQRTGTPEEFARKLGVSRTSSL